MYTILEYVGIALISLSFILFFIGFMKMISAIQTEVKESKKREGSKEENDG